MCIRDSDNVDLLNINTTSQQVCTHHYAELAFLELVYDLQSLLHGHAAKACTTWKTLLCYDVIEILCPILLACEYDNLVEFGIIKQIHQFLVLLILVQLHKVLLQTVQVQFGVGIDVIFKWILHIHLANLLRVIRESG